MALNSDDPRALRRSTHTIDEAYGAQHSRSTRGMMFQDQCRRVVRNKAHFHGSYHIQLSRLQRGRNPLQGALARLHLAFWRIRARRQSLLPGFEMGTQMFKMFNCPNMSFACTDCFGPHNIEKRIMVKKAVKRYCSNNLKKRL